MCEDTINGEFDEWGIKTLVGDKRNGMFQWTTSELSHVTDFVGASDESTRSQMEAKTLSYNRHVNVRGISRQTKDNEESEPPGKMPLLASIASGLEVESSISFRNLTSEEREEKVIEFDELICRLEDTAYMLREQLDRAKKTLNHREPESPKRGLPFLLKYQAAIVCVAQVVSILVLTLLDHFDEEEQAYEIVADCIMTVFQIVNTLTVVTASVVLSRQLLKNNVEGSFLAQTYISTVVAFAGLYFVIYRLQPSSWEFASKDKMENDSAFKQFVRMLYLSVSAATLCGAANIQPREWYVTVVLCFQSLVNFVYFASILAQTIGNYSSYTVQVRRTASRSVD